jgi:hypothetical protein
MSQAFVAARVLNVSKDRLITLAIGSMLAPP